VAGSNIKADKHETLRQHVELEHSEAKYF